MTNLIIFTGLPGTGKTTLASRLANKLNYLFLSKDAYKEILFDVLGVKDRDWSKQIGKAAIEILFLDVQSALQANQSIVIESNFKPEFENSRLEEFIKKFDIKVLQVLCKADGEALVKRFTERARSTKRHPGHNDINSLEEFRPILLKGRIDPLDIPDTIEIDTSDWNKVNEDVLTENVQQFFTRTP